MSRLYRLKEDKTVAGVCSGLAHYFDLDVTLVRVLTLVGLFALDSGVILVGYFILALIMPEVSVEEIDKEEAREDRDKRLKDIGLVLVILGGLLLFEMFIPISMHNGFWAVGLIILGVYLVYDGARRKKNE